MLHLHLDSQGETLWAVVTGAILATIGGLVATQLEARMRARERQRNAALMFGEILYSLETLSGIADETRGRGDPYGPITLRILRAGRRETETYERNRSILYDLRDAEVRIRIHVLMVQLTLALDGIVEASSRIDAADAVLDEDGVSEPRAASLRGRKEAWRAERDSAFTYFRGVTGEIQKLVAILEPIAKVDFGALKKFSGNPFANGGPPRLVDNEA